MAIPGVELSLADGGGAIISASDVEGELVCEGANVMMGYATTRADLSRGDDLHGKLPITAAPLHGLVDTAYPICHHTASGLNLVRAEIGRRVAEFQLKAVDRVTLKHLLDDGQRV